VTSPRFALSLHGTFSLRLLIAALVVGMLLLTAIALIAVTNRTFTEQMLSSGEDLFARITSTTADALESELKPARVAAQILSNSPIANVNGLNERQRFMSSLLAAARSRPTFSSAYVGTENGSFLQVRRFYDEATAKTLDAPDDSRYLARSIDRDREGRIDAVRYFYDETLHLVEARSVIDTFDPRVRPWYQAAMRAPDSTEIMTAPYVFASTGEVGITIAARPPGATAVVGVDITLASLSTLLAQYKREKGVDLVLFDQNGTLIGHSSPERTVVRKSDKTIALNNLPEMTDDAAMAAVWTNFVDQSESLSQRGARGGLRTVDLNGTDYFLRIDRALDSGNQTFYLGALMPVHELIAPAVAARNRSLWVVFGGLVSVVLVSLLVARRLAMPIDRLTQDAMRIAQFHFDSPQRTETKVAEVAQLGSAIDDMRRTIQRFLDISVALGRETNFQRLLQRILMETLSAAQATGGTLMLLSNDGQRFEGGTAFIPTQPDIDMAELLRSHFQLADVPPIAQSLLDKRTAVGRFTVMDENLSDRDARMLGLLQAQGCDAMVLPLMDRNKAVLGALWLYWTHSDDGDPVSIDQARRAFIEALSGTASVALANQQLINQQKQLLQSFIELIAGAIDAKSPYTGGHCGRVPELTKMLAHAACDQNDGPFANFALSEDEWEELHIAGWLHDCGKVTTPEFVVDKATKLETVYDRIHEVRMRFEVLKAQTEAATWRELAQSGASAETQQAALAALEEQLRNIDQHWAFVADCNVGGEFMAPERVERLRALAQVTWRRTLDDRIGVAHEELQRKQRIPAPTLPVDEPLLSDRPEHLIERPERERLNPDTAPGNPWGFALQTPELLYNRGELYNLSVTRGTLTHEDRYKINDHIVQTIKMLAALPFPKHLSRVPEIAGGHHEKLDGTGYPKRLTRAQMSAPARMMALADIFEALTAVDRPYKKGKKLSEAIAIMVGMVKSHHVDPEIFELFLRAGVHLDYAQRFMQPAYIDQVDVDAVLAAAGIPTIAKETV
jgi:HD-GYP domain-containing protein (c-di-GMP phosphodiesterase class II)